MKHKEDGYRLLHVDHVQIFGFDLVFLQTAIVSSIVLWSHHSWPVDAIPLLLLIAQSQTRFLVHCVIAKMELIDVVNMLLHYCITSRLCWTWISHYSRGQNIPDTTQQWNNQEVSQVMVQFYFPKYRLLPFVWKTQDGVCSCSIR